jgi:hypothetical protein
MNPYHRLDVGINFVKTRKKYTRTWSLGAYNTYANNNPFFVYFENDTDFNGNVTTKLKQVSLFPMIPYINYAIKF